MPLAASTLVLCKDEPYLTWARTARSLDLDSGENHAFMTARALSLRDLASRAHLLEDHLCVSALVGVGMIETHGGWRNVW